MRVLPCCCHLSTATAEAYTEALAAVSGPCGGCGASGKAPASKPATITAAPTNPANATPQASPKDAAITALPAKAANEIPRADPKAATTTPPTPKCLDGSRPVNCLADPCIATTCPVGQQCVADYCGGCNASCKPQTSNGTAKPSPAAPGSAPRPASKPAATYPACNTFVQAACCSRQGGSSATGGCMCLRTSGHAWARTCRFSRADGSQHSQLVWQDTRTGRQCRCAA